MLDHPLWIDAPPAARLAELTADTADPGKELPLRRDVRSLGILLGRVLVEQEGEAFFDIVEQLRRILIQHREQSGGATHRVRGDVWDADPSPHGPRPRDYQRALR